MSKVKVQAAAGLQAQPRAETAAIVNEEEVQQLIFANAGLETSATHAVLEELLDGVDYKQRVKFLSHWDGIDHKFQSRMLHFLVSGDVPDVEFQDFVNENEEAQAVIDFAFRIQMQRLEELGARPPQVKTLV